jgi:16S rRNA (cytidine1402-2'-O)-methyltransferase
MKGTLYLIPTTLGDISPEATIPAQVKEIVNSIDEYIVEDEKWARRYLKKLEIKKPLQEIILHPLNKHTDPTAIEGYLKNIESGKNIGIISEAGCPGVADPGAEAVRLAHQKNITVVPLVGPSSILLSLMASGFNGQSFAFNGYLPIEKGERIKKIQSLEKLVYQLNQTQLFIETPFRNDSLLQDILGNCKGETKLCIAADLTLPTEFVRTKKIVQWKKEVPALHKRPVVFLLYK